jgi:predicted regulator of Ras-like GTPase activity (Roadblock/LC7/MglB family)
VSFDEAISRLLEDCPGALGAGIIDADGIPVVVKPSTAGLELLGAELAAVLGDVGNAGRELQHGSLQQISIYAERAVVVLTTIAAGYFLVLMLDRDGLVGKGRFLSRLAVVRLQPEFI